MAEILTLLTPRFILLVLLGSVAGLFVGAIPGLSVSMATALLVSITYTWETTDALATINFLEAAKGGSDSAGWGGRKVVKAK